MNSGELNKQEIDAVDGGDSNYMLLKLMHQNQIIKTRQLELEILRYQHLNSQVIHTNGANQSLQAMDSLLSNTITAQAPLQCSKLTNLLNDETDETTNLLPFSENNIEKFHIPSDSVFFSTVMNDNSQLSNDPSNNSLNSMPEYKLHSNTPQFDELQNFEFNKNATDIYSTHQSALDDFETAGFSLPDLPEEHHFHLLNDVSLDAFHQPILPFLPSNNINDLLNHLTSNTQTPISSTFKSKSNTTIKSKKKYMEQDINCMKCKNNVATALLHCSSKSHCGDNSASILSAYVIDVECSRCEFNRIQNEHATHVTASSVSGTLAPCFPCVRAKRKRICDGNMLVCQVCKKKVGMGGFRSLSVSQCGAKEHCVGHLKGVDKTTLNIEGHSTEIVCVPCYAKYQFCTECGGGGKFRTGKYRPVELFQANKKLCALSHIRLAASSIQYHVLSIPNDIPESIRTNTRDVFFDGQYNIFATPDIMEEPKSKLKSFSELELITKKAWQNIDTYLTHKESDRPRFLIIAKMDNMSGKKASLRKLNDPQEQIQVGYVCGEWHSQHGIISCSSCCIRATSTSSIQILKQLFTEFIDHVKVLGRTSSCRALQYLSIAIDSNNSKLQAHLQKIGFTVITESVECVQASTDSSYISFIIDIMKI